MIEKVLTDAKDIDADGNDQAHGDPDARVGSLVPETDESGCGRQLG